MSEDMNPNDVMYSLSEERHDQGRHTILQPACRGTRAAMVDNRGDVAKEPLVGTVTDPVDVVTGVTRQVRPPLRHDSPDSS